MLQSVSSKTQPDISITDESFDSGLSHRYRLFLQVNDDGLNYCVLNNSSNKFILIRNYQFNTADDHEKLEDLLFSGEYLSGIDYKSVAISVASSQSTLIPSPFYGSNELKKLLGFNHHLKESDVIYSNYVRSFDLYNVFAIRKDLNDLLKSCFKSFSLLHSGTSLMEGVHLEYRNNTLPGLFVNVMKKSFELAVTGGKQLLFYNAFQYETVEDFIYYLLFVSEQLHINPELNPLMLSGTIQKDSPVFSLLYKYFRNVSFADRPDQYEYHYGFEKLPSHTYFSLFSQALCE